MNQHSEDSTQRYYDDRADEYVATTDGLDMENFYLPFLALVPSGGTILDAGCGPGRDVHAFMKRGYQVTAIDASANMIQITAHRTNVAATQIRFQDLSYQNQFDGIWACSSLLHVPSNELNDVFQRLHHALKIGGVCFMSFKRGNGERMDDGRRYIDFTEDVLCERLSSISGFAIICIWSTDDLSGRSDVQWLNALVKREC